MYSRLRGRGRDAERSSTAVIRPSFEGSNHQQSTEIPVPESWAYNSPIHAATESVIMTSAPAWPISDLAGTLNP